MKTKQEILDLAKKRKKESQLITAQHRLDILFEIINSGEAGIFVMAIWMKLRIEQSVCSNALKDLRRLDLVESHRDGKYNYYTAKTENIEKFI